MRDFQPNFTKWRVRSSATDFEAAAKNPLDNPLHERTQIVLDDCYDAYDNDGKLRRRRGILGGDDIYCQAL